MKLFTRKFFLTMIITSLVILVAGCGSDSAKEDESNSKSSGEAESYTVKVSTGVEEDHAIGQGLLKFKEIVEEKSDGRITIDVFLGGQLGDDVKLIDSLKAGTVEMSTTVSAALVGTSKEFGIFDLPFLINSNEQADAVLSSEVGQGLLDTLPEHGLVGLDYWEFGFYDLTNNKKAVKTIDDIKGLKVRTLQNEIHIDSFNKLGANPTPMPYNEVFSALESGVIDAQINPVQGVKSHKFYEVQEHLSLMNIVYSPVILLMSKKFKDKISEEDYNLIQEAVVEAGVYEKELLRAEYDEAIEYLEENGMQIEKMSDEELEKAREVLVPVYDKYKVELGEDLVNSYFEELEKLK